MGRIYILKDVGYQEYKNMRYAGIPIKEMQGHIKRIYESNQVISQKKQFRKKVFIAILTSFVVLLILGLLVYYLIIPNIIL